MGAKNTTLIDNDPQQYQNKLQKVMEEENSLFGPITIYKMEQKPYEYLLEVKERGIGSDHTFQLKTNFYQELPAHKNLAKIASLGLKKTNEICTNSTTLTMFLPYYNHTLVDLIFVYRRRRQILHEADMLYILSCLVSLGLNYNQHNNSYTGIFKTDTIFLSTEGYVKIYPVQQGWLDKYMLSESAKSSVSTVPSTSSQVMLNLSEKKQKIPRKKGKTRKDDILDLCMLLLELAFLNEHSYYYDKDSQTVKKTMVEFALNNCLHTRNYHPKLQELMKKLYSEFETLDYEMLQASVNQLRELEQIKQIYYVRFNTFEIDDKEKSKTQSDITEPEKFYETKKTEKLKAIKNKSLVPRKIELISKKK